MDIYDRYVISKAGSMEYFAGEDKTFNYGSWRVWRESCLNAGEVLDPSDFKICGDETRELV